MSAIGGRTAFLFAHYDDAAFDAAYLMGRQDGTSVDVVVCSGVPSDRSLLDPVRRLQRRARRNRLYQLGVHVTGRPVFGEWDAACGLDGTPLEVMGVRNAEHREVADLFGLPTCGLDELDSQYGRSGRARYDNAVRLMVDIVREHQLTTIVTHPPTAWHPDHKKALDIATACREHADVTVIAVCERPYTRCTRDECAVAPTLAGGGGRSTTILLDDDTWALKSRAVSTYRSQAPAMDAAFGADWTGRTVMGVECFHILGDEGGKPSR